MFRMSLAILCFFILPSCDALYTSDNASSTTQDSINTLKDSSMEVITKEGTYIDAVDSSERNKRFESRPESADEPDGGIKILTTGGFHGSEIWKGASEENWLGIFRQKNEYVLKYTKVALKRIQDGLIDEDGETTGIEVSTSDGEPVLLISGSANLKEGFVPYVSLENYSPDEPFKIKLNSNVFVINTVIKGGNEKEGYYNEFYYTISGKKNGKEISQVIRSGTGSLEIYPSIIWIGDLDHDDFPDLIMNLSGEENMTEIGLLLSSSASENELVKLIGKFTTVGC